VGFLGFGDALGRIWPGLRSLRSGLRKVCGCVAGGAAWGCRWAGGWALAGWPAFFGLLWPLGRPAGRWSLG
jgi:hypothetical protein